MRISQVGKPLHDELEEDWSKSYLIIMNFESTQTQI